MAEPTFRFYRGRSMAGTFRVGDRLTVVAVPVGTLVPGDVVAYRRINHVGVEEELVHRVMGVGPDGLIAKGDANFWVDATRLTPANLTGKVVRRERAGRWRKVRGGRWGVVWARGLAMRRRLRRLLGSCLRPPYRRLRESGLVARFWRPSLVKVRVATDDGPLVKFVRGTRTVARWWPEKRRFDCRKPYDLVITAPPAD